MSNINNSLLIDLSFAGGDFDRAQNGDVELIKGINNLKQALHHRLITVKGSLVHRPDYGIGIQQYQNRVARLDTQKEIASEIRRQFPLDPRVQSVDSVSFTMASNGTFTVKYKITSIGLGELNFTEEIGGI